MTARKYKDTPPRLERVFQEYREPLYFVTVNTWHGKAILANTQVRDGLVEYGKKNAENGRALGRFVVMPDHIHFFVRIGHEARLNDFVRLMKQYLGKVLRDQGHEKPWWQPGFFDHLLRNSESYTEKWRYIVLNPVRAGLVEDVDDWPYQGEVVVIDRV